MVVAVAEAVMFCLHAPAREADAPVAAAAAAAAAWQAPAVVGMHSDAQCNTCTFGVHFLPAPRRCVS